jgi:hypothetical protein
LKPTIAIPKDPTMSNIAHKTAPPGSWPSHQAESGETARDQTAATPRSPPAVPEYQGLGGASSVDESQSGEYTHRDPQAKTKEENGKGPDEEQQPIEMKDETGTLPAEEQQETVEMKDVGPRPVDKKEQGKEEKEETVKGDNAPDVEQQEEKQEEKGDEAQEAKPKAATDDVEAPAETATNASLTEKAKQAFDQASENQPTNEARDIFLKAARDNLVVPKTAEKTDSLQPQEEEQQQQAPESEAPEKTAPAAEKAPTEKAEDIPDAQEELVPGTQEKLAETEEKAAPQPAEEATPELQTQEQPSTSEPEAEAEPKAKDQPTPTSEEAQPQQQAEEEEEQPKLDFTILKNGTVNKGGNIVSPNNNNKIVGRVTQGILSHLVGKKVDEEGNIWSSSGKVVGKAEPIPDSERDELLREPAPFESFPDAVVDKDGMVVTEKGEIVGRVVEGDKSLLRGKSVDADGDVLDKAGNVIGRAERWEPEPEKEPEPEPEVDKSVLAGKRVNKAGNVVDGNGVIFGRVVEGDVKRMVGRMCDKKGNVLSESGDILGKADLVPEGEREGLKEGPFAELQGCTVAKDGTIVTPAGDVVGRLTSGDGKVLFGRTVDEDGDILDKNGNVVGKAERWEPEKVERKKNPMSGRRVNREGNVVDEDGNIIGKLTSGDLSICSGKDIDDDGDVVDYKGNTVGHCSLLEDIPEEPKEEESLEEKEKREQAERDKKLAVQMSVCIEQCLDSIRPICKMITEVSQPALQGPSHRH